MMSRISRVVIFLFIVALALLEITSCATEASRRHVNWKDERELVSNYGYVALSNGHKILPRYSLIDEVTANLGEPSRKEYFERGTETLQWNKFWVYSYGNGDLTVYFDSTSRRVIQIISRIPGLQSSSFPFGLSRESKKKAVLESVLSCPGVTEASILKDGVMFALGELKEPYGMILFDSSGTIMAYSVFYFVPWKGDGE